MTVFHEVLKDYWHLIRQGIPFIIFVNNTKIFDGNVTDIKKQMTKEKWKELLDYKCTEYSYSTLFQTAVFKLTKEVTNNA